MSRELYKVEPVLRERAMQVKISCEAHHYLSLINAVYSINRHQLLEGFIMALVSRYRKEHPKYFEGWEYEPGAFEFKRVIDRPELFGFLETEPEEKPAEPDWI